MKSIGIHTHPQSGARGQSDPLADPCELKNAHFHFKVGLVHVSLNKCFFIIATSWVPGTETVM